MPVFGRFGTVDLSTNVIRICIHGFSMGKSCIKILILNARHGKQSYSPLTWWLKCKLVFEPSLVAQGPGFEHVHLNTYLTRV